MAKPEWGLKRTCHSCGTRFYDMMRTPAVCPKCSTTIEPEAPFKTRRQAAAESKPGKVVPLPIIDEVVEPDVEAEEVELVEGEDVEVEAIEETEEEEGDLIEDTSDLGEDDDDMAEVMEHLDEDLENEG